MKIEEFISEITKLNINYTNEMLEKLNIYKNYLIEYNSHTNITAIKTPEDIYLKHFYDSLTINKYISNSSITKLLDIGSGAGFPGIVLKIFNPELEVVLLDSNNKKTKFLTELIQKLELENISVVNERAEEYIKDNREKFDIVTGRAVANIRIFLELGIPYLKIKGKLILMKANEKVTNLELAESKQTLEKLSSKITLNTKFKLPIEDSERTIIIIEKQNKTDNIYPRSYDKILKKPLK